MTFTTNAALERYFLNPYSAGIFCINHGDEKAFFQFEIIKTVLVSSFRFSGIPWVHYKYFNFYSAGIDFRRQG